MYYVVKTKESTYGKTMKISDVIVGNYINEFNYEHAKL